MPHQLVETTFFKWLHRKVAESPFNENEEFVVVVVIVVVTVVDVVVPYIPVHPSCAYYNPRPPRCFSSWNMTHTPPPPLSFPSSSSTQTSFFHSASFSDSDRTDRRRLRCKTPCHPNLLGASVLRLLPPPGAPALLPRFLGFSKLPGRYRQFRHPGGQQKCQRHDYLEQCRPELLQACLADP